MAVLLLSLSLVADARKKPQDLVARYPALEPYFSTPVTETMHPDEDGFIRRWLLLDEEAGRAMFKRLVDEVRGTFKGVEYNEN